MGQVAELRRAAAVLLLALLEGGEQHSRSAVCLMRKELKLPGMRLILEGMVAADQRDVASPYRRAIFPLYVLMCRLVEEVDDDSSWQLYAEETLQPTQLPYAGRWLRGAVENVEIVNGRGELERVHFSVLCDCCVIAM